MNWKRTSAAVIAISGFAITLLAFRQGPGTVTSSEVAGKVLAHQAKSTPVVDTALSSRTEDSDSKTERERTDGTGRSTSTDNKGKMAPTNSPGHTGTDSVVAEPPTLADITRRFSRDAPGTITALEKSLDEELKENNRDPDEEAEILAALDNAAENETLMPGTVEAIRGMRCSLKLCEIMLDRNLLPDPSVSLSYMSRTLRENAEHYVTILHAPSPRDPDLWSVYILRDRFFLGT